MSHHIQTIENLKIAREKLQKGWTQKCYARDLLGNPVGRTDRVASCYCLIAALPNDYGHQIHAIRQTLKFKEGDSLVSWNDEPTRTHEEVIAAMDGTILRLETLSKKILVLQAAKVKLTQGWCQKQFALNSEKKQVSSYDEQACSFCLIGSLTAGSYAAGIVDENKMMPQDIYLSLVADLNQTIDGFSGSIKSLINFNDLEGRQQQEVIEMVDKTIARLETYN